MFNKERKLACSFCGKRDVEVEKLVAGPRVYICDACVALASQIMQSGSSDGQTGRGRARSLVQRVADRLRRLFPAGTIHTARSCTPLRTGPAYERG